MCGWVIISLRSVCLSVQAITFEHKLYFRYADTTVLVQWNGRGGGLILSCPGGTLSCMGWYPQMLSRGIPQQGHGTRDSGTYPFPGKIQVLEAGYHQPMWTDRKKSTKQQTSCVLWRYKLFYYMNGFVSVCPLKAQANTDKQFVGISKIWTNSLSVFSLDGQTVLLWPAKRALNQSEEALRPHIIINTNDNTTSNIDQY